VSFCVPGAVLGTFLIETRIGRRGTMVLSVAGAVVCSLVAIAFLKSNLSVAATLLSIANAFYQTMCMK
jgi:hypothetical protein